MAVPTKAAFHMITSHGLVARNNILDGSGEQMAVVGQACRKRGTIIKDIVPLGAILLQTFFEGLMRRPKG